MGRAGDDRDRLTARLCLWCALHANHEGVVAVQIVHARRRRAVVEPFFCARASGVVARHAHATTTLTTRRFTMLRLFGGERRQGRARATKIPVALTLLETRERPGLLTQPEIKAGVAKARLDRRASPVFSCYAEASAFTASASFCTLAASDEPLASVPSCAGQRRERAAARRAVGLLRARERRRMAEMRSALEPLRPLELIDVRARQREARRPDELRLPLRVQVVEVHRSSPRRSRSAR